MHQLCCYYQLSTLRPRYRYRYGYWYGYGHGHGYGYGIGMDVGVSLDVVEDLFARVYHTVLYVMSVCTVFYLFDLKVTTTDQGPVYSQGQYTWCNLHMPYSTYIIQPGPVYKSVNLLIQITP